MQAIFLWLFLVCSRWLFLWRFLCRFLWRFLYRFLWLFLLCFFLIAPRCPTSIGAYNIAWLCCELFCIAMLALWNWTYHLALTLNKRRYCVWWNFFCYNSPMILSIDVYKFCLCLTTNLVCIFINPRINNNPHKLFCWMLAWINDRIPPRIVFVLGESIFFEECFSLYCAHLFVVLFCWLNDDQIFFCAKFWINAFFRPMNCV